MREKSTAVRLLLCEVVLVPTGSSSVHIYSSQLTPALPRLTDQGTGVYSSTPISKKSSNASSLFLSSVPHAPTPSNNAASSSGTDQANDSGLRRAVNTNTSPSPAAPRRSHLPLPPERVRTRTGANVNQSPNADQNAISFVSERILYEMTIRGSVARAVVAVRWSSVRSNGASSSRKYTYRASSRLQTVTRGALWTHQIAANDTRDRRRIELSLQRLCVCGVAP
jgi:hypothetical protein